MKKFLITLVSICALAHADEKIKTGLYSHINIGSPTVSIKTLAAIKYAQEFDAKKNGVNLKTTINKNLATVISEYITTFDKAKYEAVAKQHAEEIALEKHKSDIKKTCFNTQKQIQNITRDYQSKLENEKQKNINLTLSKGFVDIGKEESAKKAFSRTFDDYEGINAVRLFNTLDFKEPGIYKQDRYNAEILFNEFIKIGRSDLALEYAEKLEKIKDFTFFASLKKSAKRNKILSPYNEKDRKHLEPLFDSFKNDLRKFYDKEYKEIAGKTSAVKIKDVHSMLKIYEDGLDTFAESYRAPIFNAPFPGPAINDVDSFKNYYIPRIKEVLRTQKQLTPEDGVFRYTYDKFNDLYLYCKKFFVKRN